MLSSAMSNEDKVWQERITRKFQRDVERICFLILSSDCPEDQIAVQRLALRTDVARYFPEKMALYDLIYESRFRRLWKQFRESCSVAA
jgi:hypothetical protein